MTASKVLLTGLIFKKLVLTQQLNVKNYCNKFHMTNGLEPDTRLQTPRKMDWQACLHITHSFIYFIKNALKSLHKQTVQTHLQSHLLRYKAECQLRSYFHHIVF